MSRKAKDCWDTVAKVGVKRGQSDTKAISTSYCSGVSLSIHVTVGKLSAKRGPHTGSYSGLLFDPRENSCLMDE